MAYRVNCEECGDLDALHYSDADAQRAAVGHIETHKRDALAEWLRAMPQGILRNDEAAQVRKLFRSMGVTA